MRRRAGVCLTVAATYSILCAPAARAQEVTRLVSINPILPLTGSFQGEYEQRVSTRVSVAVSVSSLRLNDRYSNADLKLRYYPDSGGRALHGVGFAIVVSG
jgi:hypothetical protein